MNSGSSPFLAALSLPPTRRPGRCWVGLLASLWVAASGAAEPLGSVEPSPSRQHELVRLVRQDCGSCHGMTLKGGLGPALTPEALAGKPEEGLVATIIGGRPGTPMPPWRQFLSEDEARWIVHRLLSEFPQ